MSNMVRPRIPLLLFGMMILAVVLAACGAPAPSEPASSPAEARPPAPSTPTEIVVYKSPSCGCCGDWAEHMEANGFTVQVKNVNDLTDVKRRFQVPAQLQSCHTAVIGDYVIEGHVPAAEVQRLLAEGPDVLGLAVPGMPPGSPGMDYGDARQPYDVYAFDQTGRAEIVASYGP
jgi:hypothetical protein